ncbi:MAG: ribonuclease H-like YkuK family protein [Alicyclobacillus herbarius]|nr:ribonuclease H-like YkuK family protein [Alicyclobacillus herbarius]
MQEVRAVWRFFNPTHGTMDIQEVVEELIHEAKSHPHDAFRVIIGTDSQPKPQDQSVTFVSAVIFHRIGKGARYFVHRDRQPFMRSLRQRMFAEAGYSLQLGAQLSEALKAQGCDWQIEVHLDVGEKGATKQLIREIVAWITASGYEARIKPDSYGASKVADRYTKV